MKTHALVVSKPGDPFTYRSIEVNDTLLSTEVLVEIKATGVCHTDINFAAHNIPGLFPAVLGHEGLSFSFSSLPILPLSPYPLQS
jgi:aryl-alcohol dehydrogenase